MNSVMVKAVFLGMLGATVFLVGCGGGGGGGSTFTPPDISSALVTIGAENQEEVANVSGNGVGGSASSGGFASSVGVEVESTGGDSSRGVFDFIRGPLMERLQNTNLSGASSATGVTYEFNDACISGGSVSSVAEIANINSFTLIAGDRISFTYNNCSEYGETINGSMALEITSGNLYIYCVECYSWTMEGNFNNFRSTEAGEATETFHGDLIMSHSGNTDTLSGNSLYLLEAGGDSIHMTNFNISVTTSGDMETITGSLTVASSQLNGTVTISIDSSNPLVGYVDADYPTSGTMTVTGEGGSTLIIRTISEAEVELFLDANNDGQTDAGYPQITTWSDIESQAGGLI